MRLTDNQIWDVDRILRVAAGELDRGTETERLKYIEETCRLILDLAKSEARQNGWISVETRLPDEETGLVYVAAIRENGQQMDGQSFWDEYFGWNDVEDQGFATPPRITHWRPKPELPGADAEVRERK